MLSTCDNLLCDIPSKVTSDPQIHAIYTSIQHERLKQEESLALLEEGEREDLLVSVYTSVITRLVVSLLPPEKDILASSLLSFALHAPPSSSSLFARISLSVPSELTLVRVFVSLLSSLSTETSQEFIVPTIPPHPPSSAGVFILPPYTSLPHSAFLETLRRFHDSDRTLYTQVIKKIKDAETDTPPSDDDFIELERRMEIPI